MRSGLLSGQLAARFSTDTTRLPFVLQELMKDQFGNYVVQRVLQTCDDKYLEMILSSIKLHLNELKNYTYGKHIVARVEKLIVTGGIQISNLLYHNMKKFVVPFLEQMLFRFLIFVLDFRGTSKDGVPEFPTTAVTDLYSCRRTVAAR